jgi:hypothetical protein
LNLPRAVNSYDRDAPLPRVGTRWVWEIDSPEARCLIEVTNVLWNGEEWWVRTLALIPDSYPTTKTEFFNDVGRFWEACLPVGDAADTVLRRPDIAVEGSPGSALEGRVTFQGAG